MLSEIETRQQILEIRDRRHPGAKRVVADDFSSVVYLYQKNEWFCAAGYKGLSRTATYTYKFPTEQSRNENVTEWQRKVGQRRNAKHRMEEPL